MEQSSDVAAAKRAGRRHRAQCLVVVIALALLHINMHAGVCVVMRAAANTDGSLRHT
jgi:hypothetical protein